MSMETPTPQFHEIIQKSTHVLLSFQLLKDGRYSFVSSHNKRQAWREIVYLFPDTISAEVSPPYLIIRVRKLPPRRPFTIAGVLLWLTTDPEDSGPERGRIGGAGRWLNHIDLKRAHTYSEAILKLVTDALAEFQPKRITCFSAFWQVVLQEDTSLDLVPGLMCGVPAFYLRESGISPLNPMYLSSPFNISDTSG